MGFLVWIVVGLIAGWLAGQVMKGGGYGVLLTSFSAFSAASWAVGSSGSWESGRATHDLLQVAEGLHGGGHGSYAGRQPARSHERRSESATAGE